MRVDYCIFRLVAILVVCHSIFTSANENEKNDYNLKGARTIDTVKRNAHDEERTIDISKLKSLTKTSSNLEKFKSLPKTTSNLNRQNSVSKTVSKLSKMKYRSVSETELTRMRKFADSDPDLRKISSLVGKNPTQATKAQINSAQAFVEKHPKEGLGVIGWLIGGVFAAFTLFLGGMLVYTVATTDLSGKT